MYTNYYANVASELGLDVEDEIVNMYISRHIECRVYIFYG